MKISQVSLYPIRLQLKEPFVIANVTNYNLYYVVLKLETTTGSVGYGEAIPAWEVTGETQFGIIDTLNHLCEPQKTGINLIGAEIGSLEAVKTLFNKINGDSQAPSILAHAPGTKAMLEQAVLDALGKETDSPVYSMFGGQNKPIECSRAISILPVDQTLRQVESYLEQKVGIIKLKIGIKYAGNLNAWGRDLAVIRQAREIADKKKSSTLIVADANQGFSAPEEAISFLRRIQGCLAWMEQPIAAENKLGFKTIKDACDTPIMADESVQSYFDAQLLLHLEAVDYLNLKIMKTGGLIEALRIADLAEKYGIACQMGSMLENNIGASMCAHAYLSHKNINHAEIQSFRCLKKTIGTGISHNDGFVTISSSPGFGVEVDDSALADALVNQDDSLTLKMFNS